MSKSTHEIGQTHAQTEFKFPGVSVTLDFIQANKPYIAVCSQRQNVAMVSRVGQVGECRAPQNNSVLAMAQDLDLSKV